MRLDALAALILTLALAGVWAWRSRAGDEPAVPPATQERGPEPEPEEVPIRRSLGGTTEVRPAPRGVPARWADANREALRALESGELERAVGLLEECHAALPDEPAIAGNLAEALARLARTEHADPAARGDALAHLARAIEVDSTRDDLAGLLERWRASAEAEAGFWTDESAHFRLSYDGDRAEILQRGYHVLLRELESAYQDFGELFGHFPVENRAPKIDVVLYRRAEFSRLTGLGHWAGGVFDGRVRVPVEDVGREEDSLRRVLRHELVHAFVREVGGPSVPGWLNEGLAQWLEESFPPDRSARAAEANRRLAGQDPFPLERLRGSLASWDDTEAIGLAYAQSLALVAHVERWYGERVLFEMVAGCASGRAPGDVFRERVGVALADVLADLASGWK